MPQVTFEMRADQAKVVQSYLAIHAAQGKVIEGHGKAVKSGQQLDKVFGSISGNLRSMVVGLAGGAGATAALSGFFSTIRENTAAVRQFEKDITAALSEADNMQNIGRFKDQVLNLSEAFEVTHKEAADAIAGIQNGLGHLGSAAQGKGLEAVLKLHQVLGMETAEGVAYVTKAFQAFGSELTNDAAAIDKLAKLANGLSGVENPSQFLATIAPEAQRAGASFDELSAALQAFTLIGGKTKSTASAATALLRGMGDMARSGSFQAGATFADKLQQIGQLDPSRLEKLFGAEASASILALTRRLEVFNARLAETRQALGDLERKRALRLADPAFAFAQTAGVLEKMSADVPLRDKEWLSRFGAAMTKNNAALLGWMSNAGPGSQAVMKMLPADLQPLIARAAMALGGAGAEGGLGKLEAVQAAAGQNLEADMTALTRGLSFGDPLRGYRDMNFQSNEEDARRFARMRAEMGPGVTLGRFRRLRGHEEMAAFYRRNQIKPEAAAAQEAGIQDVLDAMRGAAKDLRASAEALNQRAVRARNPSQTE